MKLLAIFMTMLMLFTEIAHRKDDHALGNKEEVEFSKCADEEQDATGPCSPFCNCVRCSALTPLTENFTIIFQSLKKAFSSAPSGKPTRISPSIWQPPKLV